MTIIPKVCTRCKRPCPAYRRLTATHKSHPAALKTPKKRLKITFPGPIDPRQTHDKNTLNTRHRRN